MLSKSPKTIWYCHHYAGSPSMGMSYRPWAFTREFQKSGHNAWVVSASFHHLLRKKNHQTIPVLSQTIDEVPFITLKTRAYEGNGIQRILNMMEYVWQLRRHIHTLETISGKPDVIIVSSAHPFHFTFLEKYARKINAKIIFEVRDLWPLSLQELLNLPAWNPLIIWLDWIQKKAYRKADQVVSLLDNAFEYMQKKGLSKDRFHWISNGVELDADIQHPLSSDIQKKILAVKKEQHFLLGYAGALGTPNAMEYLVKACAILQDKQPEIQIVIVGEGHLKEQLKILSHELKLQNIHFFSAIPKQEIPALLLNMNALYLGWNPSHLYRYGVSPNKLFDYLLAGKPIIESGGADICLIEENQCGLRCESANPQAIADCILRMYQLSEQEREQMGQNGKLLVREFGYEKLAQDFLQVMG